MKLTLVSLFCISALLASEVNASNLIPSDSYYYYKLNGGAGLSVPPVKPHTIIKVGGNLANNLGFSCDSFNPATSMTNTLNNIQSSIEGLEDSIVHSMSSAVGSLPMYMLSKNAPDLYNLMQNAMAGAENEFNISMKSCQQSLQDIRNGKSPYEDWFSISDSQGWLEHAKASSEGQDVDIIAARKETAINHGKYGVPWVHDGKNSGGTLDSQVPIRVINDVVIAGYNIMVDSKRPLDDTSPAGTTSDLSQFWPTPQDAGEFARLVLGDITISKAKSSDAQETTAGVGLVSVYTSCPDVGNTDKTCLKTIRDKLFTLVASQNQATASDLDEISSNGFVLSQEVIDELRNRAPTEQALFINRIAQDIAIENLVNEALMLRRLLIAGSQAQVIHNLKPALDSINEAIEHLNKDIDDLLFEHRIRQEMASSTLQTLMNQSAEMQIEARTEKDSTDNNSLNNGAVYKNDGGNN